jgi:ribosomal protein L11 methylase PrmA
MLPKLIEKPMQQRGLLDPQTGFHGKRAGGVAFGAGHHKSFSGCVNSRKFQ